MNIFVVGWGRLRTSEKIALVFSALIGAGMAFLAGSNGHSFFSNEVMGPLVLMWFTWQSTVMLGVLRMRSLALNHVFTETLKELSDARDGHIPKRINDLIEGFLGDKQ